MYITPIHSLSEQLNGNRFFIKRDDLLPNSFGGNKARKASYFFAELEEEGCDTIVTYGSSSSNHCRVISNIAASRGLRCFIISPTEKNKITSNSRMMNLFGAEIIRCPVSTVKETIDRKISDLRIAGYAPYFIQGGGHGNLGTRAYVDAYEEIRSFEKENGIYFNYIFHATGTGTTQAGLVCGQMLNSEARNIIGISNARKNPYGGQVVLDSVNSYLKFLGKGNINNELINFIDDYVLDGYGDYNDSIIQTIKDVLTKDGVPLDATYTGKAYWGMKEYLKKKKVTGENILFIHTGGTPLFFDDLGGIC